MGAFRICRAAGVVGLLLFACSDNDDCPVCTGDNNKPWVEVLSPADSDTTQTHRFDVQVRFDLQLKASKIQVLDGDNVRGSVDYMQGDFGLVIVDVVIPTRTYDHWYLYHARVITTDPDTISSIQYSVWVDEP